jgi:maltose alpha-D-glucosyltransferase / alpha-amylase
VSTRGCRNTSLSGQGDVGVSESPILVSHPWISVFEAPARAELAKRVTKFAYSQRWFRSKGRTATSSSIEDVFHLECSSGPVALVVLCVQLSDASREIYAVPVCYLTGDSARVLAERSPSAVVTWLTVAKLGDQAPPVPGALFDGMANTWFGEAILPWMRRNQSLAGELGQLVSQIFPSRQSKLQTEDLSPSIAGYQQSNSTIVYGQSLLTKLIRRLDQGENIELEMAQAFLDAPNRRLTPHIVSAIHYRLRGESSTLAITSDFVQNRGTAWDLVIESIEIFLERVLSGDMSKEPQSSAAGTTSQRPGSMSPLIEHLSTPLFGYLRAIAERSAEMHLALATQRHLPSFAPEPFTLQHQQSLHQSASVQFVRVADLLRQRLAEFDESTRNIANQLLLHAESVAQTLQKITSRPFDALRIRCHGDFHLGQVLFTGDDFVIIDFEGEPSRPLPERRFKHCPLRDIASMTRSIDYAIVTALRSGRFVQDDVAKLLDWTSSLRESATSAFLQSYLVKLGQDSLVPKSSDYLAQLFQFYELERCLYEVDYELNNRPDWVEIPLLGLARLINMECDERSRTPRSAI